MKSKWYLISSILQLVFGGAAVLTIVCLAFCGEDVRRWIITLILAVAYIVMGACGIVDYKKAK